MDKENAAFSISANEISCFFVLLPFQFVIVSYFFGLTNKSTLPNYVSDFLNIEFFTEESIECFLLFCLLSFAVSIVIHYLIINCKKDFCKRFFSCREYIINFIYVNICIFISIVYFLGYIVTCFLLIYIICCLLYTSGTRRLRRAPGGPALHEAVPVQSGALLSRGHPRLRRRDHQPLRHDPVSYTHLDVYKRQNLRSGSRTS